MNDYRITFTAEEIASFVNYYVSIFDYNYGDINAPTPSISCEQLIGKILCICQRDSLLHKDHSRITINE